MWNHYSHIIFKEVEKTLIWYNLNWNLLKHITVESGKNMYEQEKAYLDRFTNRENISCLKHVDVHCLINQQVVCSKYLNLSCVEPVVSTLRFIQFFGNNYFHFHGFLSEIKAKHSCCAIQPFTGFAVVTFYCDILNKGPIEI